MKKQTCFGIAAVLILFLFFIFLPGCSTSSGFQIKDLAKTDIDEISELHLDQVTGLLKILTEKLYKRNPGELKKTAGSTIESRIGDIFVCPAEKRFEELDFKDSTNAVLLGFEPGFKGDRIFALMYGLYTMIQKAYNGKCEFFVMDQLNEQNLYNSARNIEILVWRLKTRTGTGDRPLILTNSTNGEPRNLSFERLFGKLISLQDTMAKIVSNRSGRVLKEAVQIAGMAFLPIGI